MGLKRGAQEFTRVKFTGGAGVYGIALVRLLFAYIEISAGELLVAVLISLLYQACCFNQAQIWAPHFFSWRKDPITDRLSSVKKIGWKPHLSPPPHLTHFLQSFQTLSWVNKNSIDRLGSNQFPDKESHYPSFFFYIKFIRQLSSMRFLHKHFVTRCYCLSQGTFLI